MSFQYLLDNLRFLQSDVHLAVSSSKELESMLRQLGAEGRGLHQQTTSLEHTLPNHVQRRLRRVAAQRNRIVHDVDTIEVYFNHSQAYAVCRMRDARAVFQNNRSCR
ncbi:MAG: hypothetical protein MHM6MM_004076 [Cercozoa sp. M6MM]